MKRLICWLFGHRIIQSKFYSPAYVKVCGRCVTSWHRRSWSGEPIGPWLEIKP
jgi:hypothetical protein